MLRRTWLLLLLLLVGAASAVIVPDSNQNDGVVTIAPRQTQAAGGATDPWVTVDESGRPKTVTPVLTTVSGTPTVVSGAPYEVTGTIFTRTAYAVVTTSTDAVPPVATGADGGGAFAICRNTDGELAPFCEPRNSATLYPGSTYYVTWDPAFFDNNGTAGANTTVKVVGFYNFNQTDEAFSSSVMAAGWGFYQWPVTAELFTARGRSAVNITLRLAALPHGAQVRWLAGPTVTVTYSPTPLPSQAAAPAGPALYIGVPVILGFVGLMLVGTCVWNRRHRRIGLGNIMSRSRGRSGYGVAKSRRQRLFGPGSARKKEQTIRLMERDTDDAADAEGQAYRDNIGYDTDPDGARRPRRDSDALGSLVGTPTADRHFDLSRPVAATGGGGGGSNVFREEMDRQARERL